jgi:hypothetical protein
MRNELIIRQSEARKQIPNPKVAPSLKRRRRQRKRLETQSQTRRRMPR